MGNLMPIVLAYHTLCFAFRRKCIIRVSSHKHLATLQNILL